jgi:predicted nucleotidyltransferase
MFGVCARDSEGLVATPSVLLGETHNLLHSRKARKWVRIAHHEKNDMTTQEIIGRMVKTIADRFHPEKIILFGSYAKGVPNRDSDVDLLVVMRVEGSKRSKAAEIDLELADRTIPLDVIVVTPDEIEKFGNTVGGFLYPALRDGMVLYEHAA